ncbi:MAG: hypothetical protein AVDCRST_MAG68-736 [uncultured Gemmatimonadetes bacterium]|uniref:Uncharacterized protein n=1 Tax=uncultured Gemmatimonadota bacterium TaxID=203437 RepID=A0A6J4KFL5_9BACT|nr:MAG: hypothetical protein AVDCRST_MAG68-736 [uncultured Gemmatimonadota bacterium]
MALTPIPLSQTAGRGGASAAAVRGSVASRPRLHQHTLRTLTIPTSRRHSRCAPLPQQFGGGGPGG